MQTTHMTISIHKPKPVEQPQHSNKVSVIALSAIVIAITCTAMIYAIITFTSVPETRFSQLKELDTEISIITKNDLRGLEELIIPTDIIQETASIEVIEPKTVDEVLQECLGNDVIDLGMASLTRYDTPDVYYPGIDFSRFQPYMDRNKITSKGTPAYQVTHSENVYVDSMGYCRYTTTDDQFTLNGADDYVVALGTYYKPKGTCGSRFLIVTSTGMYTVITGDEKADIHTDEMNMFSRHGSDGQYAGVIEWIVDTKTLYANDNIASRMGSIHFSSVPELSGEILMIYGIN